MIINKVKNSLATLPKNRTSLRVLLCVSGGPDSVCMLYLFHALRKVMPLKLYICHLNHKLRARASDIDERYVKRLGNNLRVPVITRQEDVRGFARSEKLSMEDAARRKRYEFFFNTARDLKIDIIATAHTKDDQAETVLMRLLRGSGLRGLKGISPLRKSQLDNGRCVSIIRPMLNISRREIEEYLKAKKIKPRLDLSNFESQFFRNKVRLKLLPLLEKEYSRNIKELLCNLSDVLDKDYEYIEKQQQAIFRRLAKVKKDKAVAFSLSDFRRQHQSIQRGLIRNAIESLKGSLDDINYGHCHAIESLISQRPPGSVVDLPDNIKVRKKKTALLFYIPEEKHPATEHIQPVILNIAGITKFGRRLIAAKIIKRPKSVLRHPKKIEYMDIKKISLPLSVRLKQPGDKMMPLGMKGYKKLSDIFIDEKISRHRRNNIPLIVAADGEIAWICGVRISERFKVDPRTNTVLKICLL